MKKRIVYVTTLLPYPPDMGGKIKTFSTLKRVVKRADVYLFSFVDKREDLVFEKNLLKIGVKRCFTLVNPVIAEKHRLTQFKIFLESLLTLKPYSVYKYYKKEMVRLISRFLREEKIDVFWIDHTIQTQYLPKNFTGVKILETHNFKSDFFKAMSFQDNRLVWRFFSLYEWLKFLIYEPKELKKFDLVFAISHEEKKKIKKFNKNTKLLFPLIETTRDVGEFETKKLFFVGLMTWYPNKHGVSWFVQKVFPFLKINLPEITFDVVGDYSAKWKPPPCQGVNFHGYVKDISNYWQEASVFVVPLWYGAGIRIKILEALAHGLPVVTTPAGAEGLPEEIRKQIFIAKKRKEFVYLIRKLLSDKKFYLRSGVAGKKALRTFNENNKLEIWEDIF